MELAGSVLLRTADSSSVPAPSGAAAPTSVRVKPRLRGVSHQYGFFVSLVSGPALVLCAPTTRAMVAALVYAVSLSGLLGASALYHRVTWSPRARYWMSRLDLAMIFCLIAGSYTPIAMLVLEPPLGTAVLWVVWLTAIAGIVLKLLWLSPSKLATAAVYVSMSSIGIVLMPDVARTVGPTFVSLLLIGGFLYIAGAVVYAFQRPDPSPAVFGYHEIFHAFVLAAAAIHYIAMIALVAPSTS
jgi:hemolysin III